MTTLVMVFALVAGAVIQAVIPAFAFLGQVKVPVLLGLVIYYALTRERHLMLQAAILAGLMQDALGIIPLGYSSFCFCITGVAVSRFRDLVFVWRGVTHMLFGAVANTAVSLALFALLFREMTGPPGFGWLILKLLGSAVVGAITVPIVFKAVESMDGKVGNIDVREA